MSKTMSGGGKTPGSNRIPGLAYAIADGIELPVLDITCPQFIDSIDERKLEDLCKESARRAEEMRKMPPAHKMMFTERSFIFGKHFNRDSQARYLSGMSTYMLKLGPYLIGSDEPFMIDRLISENVGSVSARMRLRDICRYQTEVLKPLLEKNPKKELHLINIAGGTAIDSINTLILLKEEEPSLLHNRQVKIHILDIDSKSPDFARQCVNELKKPPHHFQDLDISVDHQYYDWSNSEELQAFLEPLGNSILLCASEGGVFEYGSDGEIIANLEAIHRFTPSETSIVGDIFHQEGAVDPTYLAMAETTGASLRFLGQEGLNRILDKTGWRLAEIKERNPVYLVFTLKK